MIDELLAAASCFDWISPTLAMAQDVANGPSHTFLIPVQCGWTGRDISNLLRDEGIKTWGHMIAQGHFMITVRADQAGYAHHLLERDGLPAGASPGVPVFGSAPPGGPRHMGAPRQRERKRKTGNFLDALLELLLG